MFSRILIANRGEIALRIIRTCRRLGIETVAVYSEADRDSLPLKYADKAICIGPAPPLRSYLFIPNIMSAAVVSDVDAIHPGYGFLAENPHFAEICRKCEIDFIGPSAEAMKLLGNKAAARDLAQRTGVPIVPGSSSIIEDDRKALDIAREIGYPVMIKAAAGGGGRGMRMARTDASLLQFIAAAKREAAASFGDSSVYIEKFISRARHIEVQILADSHGNVVHLGERDCTIQRRHQKLLEESPSPVISAEERHALCADAVKLMKAGGYVNAGTVEFLYDLESKKHYFIEVNTRIQVEHPVTEMVSGYDIVELQLLIAAGEKLPMRQEEVVLRGHSIECRINAEDPANRFSPCPGKISLHSVPLLSGVRVDTHLFSGYSIPPNYDSLLAKLVVHGANREDAVAKMRAALNEYIIEGVKTTIPFFKTVLNNVNFLEADYDTHYVDDHYQT